MEVAALNNKYIDADALTLRTCAIHNCRGEMPDPAAATATQ